MENMTWLLEKQPGCELEMMGDTHGVVLNFTNLLLLRCFNFLEFFSLLLKSHFF